MLVRPIQMQTLLRDLLFACRMLARERLFTSVALAMLALAIGANTAIFSVVNAVLLRALPYRDAERLVDLRAYGASGNREGFSITELETFQQRMQALEGLAAVTTQSINLTGGERPVRVRGAFVSAHFFDLFGIRPQVGRFFRASEDDAGSAPVAVISERLWHERLSPDPGLLSARLTFNGESHRIVGVVPAEFVQPYDPERLDVWLPLSSLADGRDVRFFHGLGYLAAGLPLAAAQAEAATITSQLAALDPAAHGGRTTALDRVSEVLASRSRPLLLSLFAAAAVILLIACANLAQLLLARGLERQREFSIRAALGAQRGQLLRQLLTEATVLGISGGVAGLGVAQLCLALLLALPQDFVAVGEVALDARALLFTLGISLLTAWIFGLWPALQLSRPELGSLLKESARGSGAGARWNRVRGAFVTAQVALSLVLLVGAGLLFRSFSQLLRVDVGFEPRGLLTLEYRLPRSKYPEKALQAEMQHRILQEIRAVPGVQAAALTIALPFSGNSATAIFTFPDRPPPPPGKEARLMFNVVTPEYFETLGIPLRLGRGFDEHDRLGSPAVVLVSEAMAHRYWPGQSAIGKAIQWEDGATATIVGVVGDIRHWRLEEPLTPLVYVPFAQQPEPFATVAARTSLEPLALAEPVRQALWRADPEQPMWKVRTLHSLVERNLANPRFLLTLVGAFAGLALLLTWLGLYGVIRFLVDRRTPELGIRIALGAQPREVVHLLARQGMKLVGLGLLLGLAGAWLMTGLLEQLLYGMSATDLPTFLAIALSFLPLTWLACYLPARRAIEIDPVLALRQE